MLKKRLCNFRLFLVIAVLMILSVVLAIYVFDAQIARFFIFIACLSLGVACLSLFIVFRKRALLTAMVILLFVAVPFLSICINSYKLHRYEKFNEQQVVLLGKVDDYYDITKNGSLKLVLDEVEILHDGETEWLDGRVLIYSTPEYFDLSEFKIGTYLIVNTKLEFNQIENLDKWELSELGENIVAGGYAQFYNIKFAGSDTDLADNIKSDIYSSLKASKMEHSDLAYALLFGDTNFLDEEIVDLYQNTGIAHLLAISGLNVTAIIFAMKVLFRKMRMPSGVQIAVFAASLLFYSYLCGFSISVLRASLMAIILNYSHIRGKPYDILSVLSMLASFILLINPLALFDLSFVLSFLAVLSIILLAESLSRLFRKVFYPKFANTLGVLFAIQLGLTAVNIFYFGEFKLLGIVANFVSIPLSTFLFVALIIVTLINYIIPFMGFAFRWIGELFLLLTKFNNAIRAVNISVVIPNFSIVFVVASLVLMFILSDYCFLKRTTKLTISACIATLCTVLFLI